MYLPPKYLQKRAPSLLNHRSVLFAALLYCGAIAPIFAVLAHRHPPLSTSAISLSLQEAKNTERASPSVKPNQAVRSVKP